jgi:predicted small secreted protein
MKKLLFAFVALAAMSFASCGNAQKGAAQDSDSVADSTADTTAVADSATVDTTAADTTAQA